MNKKIILGLSVLLVALFALIGGASYAWLTSTGAGDSNTYTVGEVKFEITATETTGLVVPGQPLFSDVSITNTSSVTSHLRVSFSVSAKAANGDNLDWSIGSDAANDEILIELLEDIEDSFDSPSKDFDELKAKLEKSENDFKDLKEKYKQRFLSPAEVQKEDAKMIKDSFEEPEEKKFIDVKIEDL